MPRFAANRQLVDELRREPGMRRLRTDTAAAIVRKADELAPDVTGHYRRDLQVVERGGQVTAAATDPQGHIVEFGSVNNPPYAPLRRAVRALGLRLDER